MLARKWLGSSQDTRQGLPWDTRQGLREVSPAVGIPVARVSKQWMNMEQLVLVVFVGGVHLKALRPHLQRVGVFIKM